MFPDTNTTITLLSGVDWQSDYKHVRWFDSLSEQTTYFNNRPIIYSRENVKLVRTGNQFRLHLTITPEKAQSISYLKFTNGSIDGKIYYAFVKNIVFEKENSCYLFCELDFFQSFMFDVTFKKSYIDRQHSPLSYIEDNLSLGQEMITTNIDSLNIYQGTLFVVFVANVDLSDDALENNGTWTGSPSPMFHYVVPIKQASAANTGYTYNGNELPNFKELFGLMQKDWANKIVSAYVTKYCGLNFGVDGNTITYDTLLSGVKSVKISNDNIIGDKYIFLVDNKKQFDSIDIEFDIPQQTSYNAKLNQYPYKKLILSTFNGQQLELKPQYLTDNKVKIQVLGTVGINSKIMYRIKNYAINGSVMRDENISAVLIDDSPNALPIVVDQYAAYVQGHTNSLLAAQKASSNDWQTSVKVANRTSDSNLLGSIGGGLANASSSILSGNVGGITSSVGGVTNAALQGAANIENAGDIGKNNFENLVNNQQAMLDDLQVVPPNTKSMGGNIFFEYGNFDYFIQLTTKEMTTDDKERVSDYYNKFGYKVGKYDTINFNNGGTYNYVKTFDCVVVGNVNQSILDVIKRIFNSGVFIHHTDRLSM